MSATAAATDATPAPAKGKKKLIIIVAAALAVVLAGGGGAAFFLSKKNAAEAAEEGEDHAGEHRKGDGKDAKVAPTFVPLEPFTVNLADRDAERYAQVGITLEVDDAKVGDQVKVFMPAIRNHILMAISDRTAAELMGREGKSRLADTVRRETSRVLGADVEPEPVADDESADEEKPRKKKKRAAAPLPVKAVHFSNFIIQ